MTLSTSQSWGDFPKGYGPSFGTKTSPLFHTRQSRTHAAMSTALYDGTIRTYSLVEASSFIKQLFPETSIFGPGSNQTLAYFWDTFSAAHPQAWANFLNYLHQPSNEVAIELFLTALTRHSSKNSGRSWSAANRGKPPGGDANRKPDLVCFDPMKYNKSDWSHFIAVGELKSGNFTDTYELLAERAALLFRNQDSRRFVLTFVLVKQLMTVALFDRGGSVVTESLDISQHPLLFLQFILGLTFAPLTSLGYDATVTIHPMGRTLSSKYIPNIHLLCALYVAERVHGRGTVVWLAKLKDLPAIEVPGFIRTHFSKNWSIDPAIIIKDIWSDENTSLTEGMILALLKMKGVQGVPRILAEERVLSEPVDDAGKIPVDPLSNEVKPHPIPDSARPDSTTLIRSRLNLSGFKLYSTALEAALQVSQPIETRSGFETRGRQTLQPIVAGFESRAHVRSYTTPWAVPIFQFRSGVELLGVMADTLTAHEQAASSRFVTKRDALFPFRFLHRDLSVLNMGMVPCEQSDFPACPHRSSGEHRGLLYDWGFAKVAEVKDYEGFQAMDDMDEDDANDVEDVLASSDTDIAPRSTIHVPDEDRTDSGLYTATPDIIGDFQALVKLVRHCIREEQPALEITGTRPFMAIELLVASLVHTGKKHPWRESYQDLKHEVRHDLESFYMVLVSLCLLYERPHVRKGLSDYNMPGASLLAEEEILPFCAVIWLTGQEELVLSNIRLRYLALCTSQGFATMVEPHLSTYFAPMAPYLEQIRALLYGQSNWGRGPYKRPDTRPTYDDFRMILFDAMKTIPSTIDGTQFSTIVEPPKSLYCPISPEGQWQGKSWSWDKPFPMRSNNAFGFVQDQLPSALATPSASATTTEGYMDVPKGSVVLKTRGLQPSARYALLPEVDRLLSREIKRIKGLANSRKFITKPYLVYSPSALLRRRRKWLMQKEGKGGKV